MKLLLTANGITTPELEQAFAEMTGGRTALRVALIPTAGDSIEWVPDPADSKKFTARLVSQIDARQGNEYKRWREKGFEVVITDLKEAPEKIREKLQNVDIIDVGGGDVNYLLDWAKKCKLDTYLKEILDRDVLYVGASAGSLLVQPDIGLTWWEPGDGSDHIGLGIVDFLITGGHGKEATEADVDEIVKNISKRREYLQSLINFPWKIYTAMDGQAVKVVGDTIEQVGPGVKKSI